MRWAVMIVVALVAFIIAIFAAGAVLPRKHVASVTVKIKQPPEVIWHAIANHADDLKWRSDLQNIERLPDRNGHPLWQEAYKNGMKLQLEDTESVAPKKLVREVRDTSSMFSGRWEIEITPIEIAPAGTATSIVRITEHGEVHNPFFRFMSRFVFGQSKSMEQYLTALARKFGERADFGK